MSKPKPSAEVEQLPAVESVSPPAPNGRSATSSAPPEQPRSTRDGWRRIDLHIHTAASLDYQEPDVTALDIVRRAEELELDIIAFTDHNSVRGYANLWREIEDLELLEYLKRLLPEEEARLQEYRRLLDNVLLLPGFEFTATFGFHILAIFPEGTSVRLLEHLLLLLGVPEDRFGSGEVGATSDVLRAYEVLDAHGALVIGAHVNSTHGIAMQGLRFGGQTKIAYTQDQHLHALEVTDLAIGGLRRSTARFFSGTKPEYPRRMHCIQGSDAHRLDRDPQRDTNLGIGDRATEILLPELSFRALKNAFLGDDFGLTRPYQARTTPGEAVKAARAEGNSSTRAFHESLATKRTGLSHLLRDIVAMANGDGGTVYAGVSPFEKRPIAGVKDVAAAKALLSKELAEQATPTLDVEIDSIEVDGKSIIAVQVPQGADPPYALTPGGIFVRVEGDTRPAHRDEIVAMVRASAMTSAKTERGTSSPPPTTPPGIESDGAAAPSVGRVSPVDSESSRSAPSSSRRRSRRGGRSRSESPSPTDSTVSATPAEAAAPPPRLEEYAEDALPDDIAPTTGIEILYSFEQDGVTYHTLRDLRNEKLIHNVSRDTDRRLWRLAISEREDHELDDVKVHWDGDHGYWRSVKPRGGERRYHLLYRGDGDIRVFYGVNEEGMDSRWRAVLPAAKPLR